MSDDKRGLIMAVDDNPQNIKVLAELLTKKGYDTILAMSGDQMFEALKSETPDLILLDIMMPEVDGIEVCKNLKQEEKFKDIPIIFLTAKSGITDLIKGFEVGAVDYVTKPFNSIELMARIDAHVELKQIRDELLRKNKELEEANQKLEFAVLHDALTKLFNRRYMLQRLEEEILRFKRYGNHFSVIIADIDNFKKVNDNYGHNCGDEVLKKISELMMNNKREQDIVARWGGEEFLFLVPETDLDGAILFAERIRQVIEEEIITCGDCEDYCADQQLKVTMTFGVAYYTKEMPSQDIIKIADDALYKGKQSGKNCVIVAEV